MMGQPTTNGAGRADIRDRKKRTRAADQGLRAISLAFAWLLTRSSFFAVFLCLSRFLGDAFRVCESHRSKIRPETREKKNQKKDRRCILPSFFKTGGESSRGCIGY